MESIDSLSAWLQNLRLEHIRPQLLELGANQVEDLQYISTEDLDSFSLKPLEKKKFLSEIGKLKGLNTNNNQNIPTELPSSPIFNLVTIDPQDEEFQRVEDTIDYQQHHEHYVIKRIEKKQLPITFKLVGLTKVINSTLEFAFNTTLQKLKVNQMTFETNR